MLSEEAVNCKPYVYTLARPDGHVFYIGKGQDNRIDEQERAVKGGRSTNHQKEKIIREIWASGEQVVKTKLAHFNISDEALQYEAALIFLIEGLTNVATHAEDINKLISREERKQERMFFLITWLFPKQPANTQQIREELDKHLQQIQEIGQAYQTAMTQNGMQIQGLQQSIEQINLEMNLLTEDWNTSKNTMTLESLIDQLKSREFIVNTGSNTAFHAHEMVAQFGTNMPGRNGQKSFTFTPTSAHKKAVEYIQNHPEWVRNSRRSCAPILVAD